MIICMPRLSLDFLGPFQARLDGQAVTRFESNNVRALLAYLAMENGRAHSREELAALLWPEESDRAARKNLRQALANLRQAIGDHTAEPPFLHITRQTVQFNTASDHQVDVIQFKELLAACESHPHRHPDRCSSCAGRRRQAVELYGGDFLAQLFVPDSAPFEEWALLQRERLQLQALAALDHLAGYYEGRGEWPQVRRYAQRQLALDPWREEAYQQLMRALAASGQRSAALARYRALGETLEEELGVSPTAATTALYERILAANTHEILFPAPPEPALPQSAAPLVGRRGELAHLVELLDRTDGRLVTLAGPGGVGKTRLALEVAWEQAAAFSHGAYFVSLAPLSSADFLGSAIVDALPLTLAPQEEPRQRLLGYLQARELLLVLDNFEHLLPGAALVAELLQAAPGLSILVTSRERLKVAEEWVVDLAGLATEIRDADVPEAVALFQQQAQRVRAGWQVEPSEAACVVDICRLVEGFPLAIELAATWLRSLTCAEIAAELEQDIGLLEASRRPGDPHQASLQTVFDRSWCLLTSDEQRLLAWLSVFRGGFDRETATAVAGASLPLLSQLVEKSLIWRDDDGRYSLHELLRHYAANQLESLGQTEAAGQAHLSYFLSLAGKAAKELEGPHQLSWLDRLEREHHNLREALRRARETGDTALAARLAGALGDFWFIRGHVSEGIYWLNEVLAHETTAAQAVIGRCQRALGLLCYRRGDLASAMQWLERADETFTGLDDQAELARTLIGISLVLRHQGTFTSARNCAEKALALAQDVGDRYSQAVALQFLGYNMAKIKPDYAAARSLLEESLVLWRKLGNQYRVAWSLYNLGYTATLHGDYLAARAFLEEGLGLQRQMGAKRTVGYSLAFLGFVAWNLGEYIRAQDYYEQAMDLLQELHDRRLQLLLSYLKGLLHYTRGEVALAHECSRQATDLARQSGHQLWLRYALTLLGHSWLVQKEAVQAQTAYQEAYTFCQAAGQSHLAMEPLAGLARVALVQGDLSLALNHVEEILACVAQKPLEGPHYPFLVYLTCIQVLQAVGDPRAAQTLGDVYEWLQARAARLPTQEMQQTYLAIPAHREILALWGAATGA
jgi:predicted ATPase/DNA-binding SARP family transcriptional activator